MKDQVIIKRTAVGAYQANAYLAGCPRTLEAALIDPGGDVEKLLGLIEQEGLRVRYILNTHEHHDHTAGNREMKARLSAPICMHESLERFFPDGTAAADPADIRLKDGDALALGDLTIQVLHTPGHTPGSVCFLIAGNLFSGDTLFVGNVGRTDLAGGSRDILLESLEKKVITLPKETIVQPGHDYGITPTSTIAREMEENPYITDFILA
ncbi:MAG: MBL fold metallo-hydrolase [Desulfobacterales bacterium]|nr:MBL fold metallo-hydrolase [Desulfobacterales bacterium]